MCVVRRPGADTAGANRVMREIRSSRGRSVLKRFGFGLTPRG
jgi:molybdate transport system substrate-binding protein